MSSFCWRKAELLAMSSSSESDSASWESDSVKPVKILNLKFLDKKGGKW